MASADDSVTTLTRTSVCSWSLGAWYPVSSGIPELPLATKRLTAICSTFDLQRVDLVLAVERCRRRAGPAWSLERLQLGLGRRSSRRPPGWRGRGPPAISRAAWAAASSSVSALAGPRRGGERHADGQQQGTDHRGAPGRGPAASHRAGRLAECCSWMTFRGRHRVEPAADQQAGRPCRLRPRPRPHRDASRQRRSSSTTSRSRVADGERWLVLGANGSGKTSLLRIAALYEHPTSGTVDVLGERLGRTDVRVLRRRVGYASAALADQLRPSLRGPRRRAHGPLRGARAVVAHATRADDDARALDCLERMGVGRFADRPLESLSSGERQRVLLARTLMNDPAIVLLDEPSARLDLGGREQLVARARRPRRRSRRPAVGRRHPPRRRHPADDDARPAAAPGQGPARRPDRRRARRRPA